MEQLSLETNVVGAFEIVKDVFVSSARSSEENKCCQCSKKAGSRGTKDSKGEESKGDTFKARQLSASGNQFFTKMSPLNSPLAVFD